ncbi:MAG: GNAT family N-acetyltransferase [Haloarculaceae archaeon]
MTDADVTVREATVDELAAVLGVLDGVALETDAERMAASIDRGDALVAVTERRSDADGTIVGALVLDGAEITSVAVRRRRRGQGIGTALVAAASDRRDRLVAEFDERARPFYEALGFTVELLAEDGRYRGELVVES